MFPCNFLKYIYVCNIIWKYYMSLFIILLLSIFFSFHFHLLIGNISEFEAVQSAFATFFPLQLLSGIIWPNQAMPRWLYYISLCLPTTWVANAFRDVMIKGTGKHTCSHSGTLRHIRTHAHLHTCTFMHRKHKHTTQTLTETSDTW